MASSSSTSPEITPSRTRCIVEHDTETLSLELINYLQLKGMEVGKFVSSPVFRVGGYEWEIRFYPHGVNKDCTGTSSCLLCYLGKDKDVRAKFTLSMMETKGLQAQVASFGVLDYRFAPELDVYGYPGFVSRWKLKSLSRLGDGCFTIRCVLTVMNESPPLELHDDLERMLEEGLGADVTFAVGGREFGAHRSLLAARSPMFRAQFFGPMAEKDTRHVEVIDMEPTIFEMILRYIYTDELPSCNDDGRGYNAAIMQHLLIAADRYGLNRLKLMCEEELCKRMDVETLMTTLSLADRHHCERLKDTCVKFMLSKKVMSALTETDGFKEYINTYCRPLPLEDELGKKGQPSTETE